MDSRTLSLDVLKARIREETENSPLTFFEKRSGREIAVYPYCILPLERDTSILGECVEALARLYIRMFAAEGVTTLVFPESKAFLLASLADRLELRGALTRKRDYGIPEQIDIAMETAYREKDMMHCAGLSENDSKLVLVEDMISGGFTVSGHIEAFEEAGFEVAGAISVYERGDGIRSLEARYPDKRFAGFARLEILPDDEFLERMKRYEGIEREDVTAAFLSDLRKEYSGYNDVCYRDILIEQLNKNFSPVITRFCDE